MKTFNKTILVLMAVVAISLTSCKKDDDGGDGGGGAASGTVSAKVNGSSYNSEPLLTSAVRSDANGTSTLLITANTMNGKNITLSIAGGFDGVGSYNIGGGANVFNTANYTEIDAGNPTDAQIWTAPFDTSVAGEIKVSDISSTNIKGTFNFRGKNADGTFKEITEGSFNVNF
ncbi:DUF6252 family protein [Aequorivita sp. CIP111184]|uniref:DUF6252 family protein n=1 Tax=Aequorivita sp. CIP111184 TaxID=2211356 RepID=UPI000DBC263A|nr:DUF6252 family protein [Aequorivita sp. CIP111184]SRX54586.1 hypothetical protein AEQU1_01597 [Aequorivita sp. CIP111184]